MAPPMYLSEDQKQDSVGDETLQATSTLCTPAPLLITELPPECTSLQPTTWQYQPNSNMDLPVPRSWDPSSIMNNHGPTMFDWYSSPVNPWNLQSQDLDITSQAGQIMGFQSPLFNNGTQTRPFESQKSFDWGQAWQHGQHAQETDQVAEAVPQLWHGSGIPASNPPESNTLETLGRASKRRRRSSTSSTDGQLFAPLAAVPGQPLSVEDTGGEQTHQQYVHGPTSTFPLPEVITSNFRSWSQKSSLQSDNVSEGATLMTDSSRYILPSAEAIPLTPASQASPVLTPSVRVISDRRETTTKSRRGDDAVFKTQSANSKRGHYASEVWESHKPAIKKMYIDEGKPLREVINTMEREHHFPATQRMYKARFKQWGFVKNNTEKVVSQILRTKFERDAAGKLSRFTRNGKDVNLQNYLQRKGLTEYDLVDFHPAADALPHVRCRTPPFDVPEDLRLPDRLRFQDTLVMSFKRAFLLWRQEDQDNAFGFQPSVFTWRVTDFPHLSNLIASARLIRRGDGAMGVAALNQAFWSMKTYLASMDATASFYFFFHRQSRPWQEDPRIALAVWKFLAAYASAKNRNYHPLFHTFRLMYEVVQKEGVTGLRELLAHCSNTVADELERTFGREHWLKDLIWHRCFPEKSKLRHLQLVRDLRDHGPAKKIVRRLY